MSPPHVSSPAPRRANRRWMVVFVELPTIIVVGLGALFVYQLIGPAHAARERGIAVLRQQTALLPPYAGSEAADTIVYDQPFRDPAIQIDYTLPGACTDVQTYYAAQTEQNGWSMTGPVQVFPDPANPSDPGHDDLHGVFHKGVQGYALDLEIDCYPDQSYSPGYTFGMTAH
jgi:hypothetical protein